MNKQIMEACGFGNEVALFDAGFCPDCKFKIDNSQFRDILSIKEHSISGLCQQCQDKIFGESGNEKVALKSKVVINPNDFVIQGSLFNCEHWGGPAVDMKFDKYIGKSRSIWYIADCEEKAAHVFCSNNDKHGFGGSELNFPLKDGAVDVVKGPWHGNADSLYSDTGIDIRHLHYTQGIISEGRDSTGAPSYFTIMREVLYRDFVPIMGSFHRVVEMAMNMAKKMDKELYCYSESRGGSSCGLVYPDQINVYGKRGKK